MWTLKLFTAATVLALLVGLSFAKSRRVPLLIASACFVVCHAVIHADSDLHPVIFLQEVLLVSFFRNDHASWWSTISVAVSALGVAFAFLAEGIKGGFLFSGGVAVFVFVLLQTVVYTPYAVYPPAAAFNGKLFPPGRGAQPSPLSHGSGPTLGFPHPSTLPRLQ